MKQPSNQLRVGVVGVGHMGRHHLRIAAQTDGVQLAGLHEIDEEKALQYSQQYGCQAFATLDSLLQNVDAVIVAAPTSAHPAIGEKCLAAGKHIMVEKPLADSVSGARRLVELAEEAGVALMAGHVERYNPAIRKLLDLLREYPEEIVTIDARRLAPFDGSRCLDVDVLYDLLIHDIDLALEIAGSPVDRVSAAGRPVFSRQADFVHAQIVFRSRAAAVLWAAKCTPRKMRSLTVTTPSRCYEVDTIANSLVVHTAEQMPALEKGVCFMGSISSEVIAVPHEEPLRAELEDFFAAIRENRRPLVDGRRALADIEALGLVAGELRRVRE